MDVTQQIYCERSERRPNDDRKETDTEIVSKIIANNRN